MSTDSDRAAWAAAFQRATWGCAPAIGRALGLSARTVQLWGRAENEKRSPGERLETVVRVALEHRKPHDALAPIHLLAARLGYRLVPDGEADDADGSAATLGLRASQAMIEAGEAVQAVLEAQADGVISNEELDQIHRECDEAIEALTRLKRAAAAAR